MRKRNIQSSVSLDLSIASFSLTSRNAGRDARQAITSCRTIWSYPRWSTSICRQENARTATAAVSAIQHATTAVPAIRVRKQIRIASSSAKFLRTIPTTAVPATGSGSWTIPLPYDPARSTYLHTADIPTTAGPTTTTLSASAAAVRTLSSATSGHFARRTIFSPKTALVECSSRPTATSGVYAIPSGATRICCIAPPHW